MKRYSDKEKAEILKEIKNAGNIRAVCQKRGISHATAHNWLKKATLINSEENYSAEQRQLKKKIEKLELQNAVLKDLVKRGKKEARK